MFLNPTQLYEDGLLINSLTKSKPAKDLSAEALKIKVYIFGYVPISPFLSQAEFIVRRIKCKDIREWFTYIVDGISCWRIRRDTKQIIIGICEGGGAAATKLIQNLCQKYNVPPENVTLTFFNEKFISNLVDYLAFDYIPRPPKELVLPTLLVYTPHIDNKWRVKNNKEGFIDQICLTLTNCKFKYRVYSRKKWLDWHTSGQKTGIPNYPISGFQFEFENPNYKFYYRCKLADGFTTEWRDTSMKNPYQKNIIKFEFKLEQIT